MNRLNVFISKLNFKKIIVSYIIIAVIAVIGCTISIGIVFKDSLSFAWQFGKVNEAIENLDEQSIKPKLEKLALSSSNLIDVLILNNNNEVTFSAKNSELGSGQFILSKSEEKRNYLTYNKNENIIFKFVKGDKFLLSSVFDYNFEEIRRDYEDQSFYKSNYSEQTVYMLTYLGDRNSAYKIYIISNPYTTEGGELALKIAATIGILIFMVYWVLLALWVYQNAMKARLRPFFWGGVVLITNIAGVFVYLMYKFGNNSCPSCGASQEKSHKFCTYCGAKIGKCCVQCGTHVSKNDKYCPSCGEKLN